MTIDPPGWIGRMYPSGKKEGLHCREKTMLSNRINHLVPPPRPVPLRVICSAMFGITGRLGAIFLISGLAFTLVFTAGYRPVDELRLAFSKATAQGTITKVSDTNSTENDEPVYAYEFSFTTHREQKVSGMSYSTERRWRVEDRVTIEYVEDAPAIARIQGARSSEFSPWVLFVLIFPLVGAALFGTAAIGGWRQASLLRHGEVADAHILSTRPTNVSVNNVPVLEYAYELRTAAGETFNGSAKSLPSDRLGDEENEPALYLPSNPDRSTLVDAISLRHPLDVDNLSGQWISQEGFFNTGWYILTWIAVIALSGYGLLRALGVFR
jgi:hypothetical protein